ARAQFMRGRRLPDGADVVAFAFDREQHGALDGARLDAPALPFELARWQRTFLKNETNGLQIKFRRQIEHGEVLVVERLGDLRLLVLALRQMIVQFAMRLQMALDVHAHERRELHEARIDAAKGTGIAQRHGRDQVLLKPLRSAWNWRARSPWSD